MASIKTVRIDASGGGFVTINESDFNSSVHRLFGEPEEPVADEADEEALWEAPLEPTPKPKRRGRRRS